MWSKGSVKNFFKQKYVMKYCNIFSFNFDKKFSRKTCPENRKNNLWKTIFLQFGVGSRKVAITKERKDFKIEKSSLNIGNFKIVTKADKEGFENKS